MSVITYGLVSLYAVLTGLAGVVQWKVKGFDIRLLYFILMAASMIMVLWLPNKMIMLGMLIVAFLLLHILAIVEGLKTNGKLRTIHHIVRFIFHLIVVFLVYQFIV